MSGTPHAQVRVGWQYKSCELHFASEVISIREDAVFAKEHPPSALSLTQDQVDGLVKDRKGAAKWDAVDHR